MWSCWCVGGVCFSLVLVRGFVVGDVGSCCVLCGRVVLLVVLVCCCLFRGRVCLFGGAVCFVLFFCLWSCCFCLMVLVCCWLCRGRVVFLLLVLVVC